MISKNSFNSFTNFKIGDNNYYYFSLNEAEKNGLSNISKYPYSIKIIIENLLRNEDDEIIKSDDINFFTSYMTNKEKKEIFFHPTRILMQDFTGVPAIVDLASMRNKMMEMKKNASKINPIKNVDLVIDHSLMVDSYGSPLSINQNLDHEYSRNKERYEFLKWGQQAFKNFRVVPPGTGICHQVNLEYLSKTVWTSHDYYNNVKINLVYPDTLVGTDSHTTMINALSVLGWGVGGIEAEAAMLGQPLTMNIPEVIGFKIKGKLNEGVTSTDLVLTITNILRKKGVVGKFIEFYGSGLKQLSVADRATISNMAPEYGATCGFFPIDDETLSYLHMTGRPKSLINLVKIYAQLQLIWRDDNTNDPIYPESIEFDLSDVEPNIAGPKRPQDRILVKNSDSAFIKSLNDVYNVENVDVNIKVKNTNFSLDNGHVCIAAITSCTNTSNPSVMVAAGILAKNAVNLGLNSKPWVKTSLAPGSKVVTQYLEKSGLQKYLDILGFNLIGYGCTTCIGNSGPINKEISDVIKDNNLVVTGVLSGNRNFEGRINPLLKANYLASPPLVVAYALAGTMKINLLKDPIGITEKGANIYLKDIWPTNNEINQVIKSNISPEMFKTQYSNIFKGDKKWKEIKSKKSVTYEWDSKSTYVKKPPFFNNINDVKINNIFNARILSIFGDSVTTDHISPAGSIPHNSPAGNYLIKQNVDYLDFNSFGARRGNHEVMIRGTFSNIRIKNEMLDNVEGGYTYYYPDKTVLPIYDVAMLYQKNHVPLVIFAGKEYGTGSSRDWAAKGTQLLGVKAVIAESFERIHRSNLLGMGVLPLQFVESYNRNSINLTGEEIIDIIGIDNFSTPNQKFTLIVKYADKTKLEIPVLCRIDTLHELEYFKNGGILPYVLNRLC